MIKFCRKGASGNIFLILGRAACIMDGLGCKADAAEMAARVFGSDSYDKALEIIGEYVYLEEVEEESMAGPRW